MRKKIIWILIFVLLVGLGWWGMYKFWPVINPVGENTSVDMAGVDYSKYDFDSLRKDFEEKRVHDGSGANRDSPLLEIGERIEEVDLRRKNLDYTTEEWGFDSREISFVSEGKKISGMINYQPWKSSKSPVVIMVRGYADKEGYYPGFGSWRVADELAKAGLATISIDFLGYGQSDQESFDNLEARFEKVKNLLDLLNVVKNLPWVDKDRIGFWAHSNGGQVTLSTLEIDGGNYPVVLWAPMTNPFPQSVLETIDAESPVKQEIENFMKYYDSRRFAFENYYDWLNSPILIIQGDNDIWCEVEWQKKVVADLNSKSKKAELVVIPGAGHNMENGWLMAVEKTKIFMSDIIKL